MSKESKEYLRHIQDECSYIISVSENLLFDNFLKDETLKRAIVKKFRNYWRSYQENPCRFKGKMAFYSMEKHGWNA
ncbi:MAG: hypothetical protein JWM28_1361 [Chitinophagaceae bacterium]|nr:hypothetical protein [Chitinophagaceae bacterium]